MLAPLTPPPGEIQIDPGFAALLHFSLGQDPGHTKHCVSIRPGVAASPPGDALIAPRVYGSLLLLPAASPPLFFPLAFFSCPRVVAPAPAPRAALACLGPSGGRVRQPCTPSIAGGGIRSLSVRLAVWCGFPLLPALDNAPRWCQSRVRRGSHLMRHAFLRRQPSTAHVISKHMDVLRLCSSPGRGSASWVTSFSPRPVTALPALAPRMSCRSNAFMNRLDRTAMHMFRAVKAATAKCAVVYV